MKYVDIAVTVIFILALVVIYFFWGCEWDLYATILIGIVITVSVLIGHAQNKKINEYEEKEESSEE